MLCDPILLLEQLRQKMALSSGADPLIVVDDFIAEVKWKEASANEGAAELVKHLQSIGFFTELERRLGRCAHAYEHTEAILIDLGYSGQSLKPILQSLRNCLAAHCDCEVVTLGKVPCDKD